MSTLIDYNGCLMLGSYATPTSPGDSAITPQAVSDGVTVRSDVFDIPRGVRYLSVDITMTPDAACAATVKLRTGNRKVDPLPSPIVADDPTVFDSFNAATSAVFAIDPDTNFVQLEVTPSGANVTVSAFGTVK